MRLRVSAESPRISACEGKGKDESLSEIKAYFFITRGEVIITPLIFCAGQCGVAVQMPAAR